jgi:cystathionine beta-lyase
MIYDFDRLPDRRDSESIKWHKYGEDVLPMWVADMDFISPQPVIQALEERVSHGVFGYPDELPQLRQVLVERLAQRYKWQVAGNEILFMPGVVPGLNLACSMYAVPGGEVVVQTPVYPPFLEAPGNGGMRCRQALLDQRQDSRYSIDWEAFEGAINARTQLFILCNPHNPVGRVFRQDELERMAEICLNHGVAICSDEIHCDLLYSGQQHIPLASLDRDIAQNTITFMAPSKTFNLAGLKFSFAIIQNRELRRKFRRYQEGVAKWANLMGRIAALAAYRDGQEWLDQVLAYLEGNRDWAVHFVQEELPGITAAVPEGTYLAWLDCRQSGIQGNPYEYFLERARVALNDGETFGTGGEGFVRLNFGCPRSMLVEALERMKAAL